MTPTFWTKITAILMSVRFWIITLTAVIGVLNGQDISIVIQVWLAAIAGMGTLDSIANKIGGATTDAAGRPN